MKLLIDSLNGKSFSFCGNFMDNVAYENMCVAPAAVKGLL